MRDGVQYAHHNPQHREKKKHRHAGVGDPAKLEANLVACEDEKASDSAKKSTGRRTVSNRPEADSEGHF
jgi:hypothetical protein